MTPGRPGVFASWPYEPAQRLTGALNNGASSRVFLAGFGRSERPHVGVAAFFDEVFPEGANSLMYVDG